MQLTCKIPIPGQLTVLKPYKANQVHNKYGAVKVRVRNDAGVYAWYGGEYFEPVLGGSDYEDPHAARFKVSTHIFAKGDTLVYEGSSPIFTKGKTYQALDDSRGYGTCGTVEVLSDERKLVHAYVDKFTKMETAEPTFDLGELLTLFTAFVKSRSVNDYNRLVTTAKHLIK